MSGFRHSVASNVKVMKMNLDELTATASRRVEDAGYAGDVTPAECWAALREEPAAALVDVRSHAEWVFSGHPDLAEVGKRPVMVSWRLYPEFDLNPGFMSELTSMLPEKEAPVFLLCKTGGRSAEAAKALTQEGYGLCFNVVHGFEGDADASRRRGRVNGWKAEELPWVQA